MRANEREKQCLPSSFPWRQQQQASSNAPYSLLTSSGLFPLLLQNVDIARNVTALQDTTTATVNAPATGTESIATATGGETVTGIATVAAEVEVEVEEGMTETDVSRLERDTVAEITMTIRDVLMKMTETDADLTSGRTAGAEATAEVEGEGAAEEALLATGTTIAAAVDAVEAENAKKTAWAHRKEDLQPLKAPSHCHKEGERHLGGIFLHLDMSNTLQDKRSRQVSPVSCSSLNPN